MSEISELRSAISEYNSKTREVERENAEMRSDINAIESCVARSTNALVNEGNSINNSMENNTNIMDYANSLMENTYDTQVEIERIYFNFKNIETANKTIRYLENEKYYEFKSYRTIRKIVAAFLTNLDLSVVSEETIFKSIEKEYLKEPDYWLACVMLALLYWKKDDKDKADECMANAMKLNGALTSIFMMLFYSKLGRIKTSILWFEQYLQYDMTGGDNSTLLMFISSIRGRIESDDIDDPIAIRIIEEVRKQLGAEDMLSRYDAIDGISDFMRGLSNPAVNDYKVLQRYVDDYRQMRAVMRCAKNNEAILEYFDELNKVKKNELNAYADVYIQSVLEVPSPREKEVQDKIDYQEQVIADNGNLEDAKANFDAKVKHDTAKLDPVSEILNWLYGNSQVSLDTITRWNMFMLVKPIIVKAVENVVGEYRKANTETHSVTINEYRSMMNLTNSNQECQKIDAFYEQEKAARLKRVKNTWMILAIVLGALGLVGGIVLVAIKIVVPVGFLLIGAGVVAILYGIFGILSNAKRRVKIIRLAEDEKKEAQNIAREISKEYLLYKNEYDSYDAIYDDITSFFKRYDFY